MGNDNGNKPPFAFNPGMLRAGSLCQVRHQEVSGAPHLRAGIAAEVQSPCQMQRGSHCLEILEQGGFIEGRVALVWKWENCFPS